MSTVNKKILVVDDDAVVLKATTLILKNAGYQVITAKDGTCAVTSARTEKPDAILLDLTLDMNSPDDFGSVAWDGYRIIEWLKRLEGMSTTPIIVVSGSDPAKAGDRVQKLGATAFFRKPVNPAALLAELQRLLAPEVTAAS